MSSTRQLRRDPPHRGQVSRRETVRAKSTAAPTQPASSVTRIGLLTILLASVMVLGASRLGPLVSQQLQQRTKSRELAELETLDNEQLSGKLADWLDRGPEGLRWITSSLPNPRAGISYAAEQALLREADSWRYRPAAEAAERMLAVAHGLISIADRLPAARRPAIRRLVERFATWPVEDAVAARELTAACEAIIARLPPASAEELQLADNEVIRERRVASAVETLPPVAEPPAVELDRSPIEITPPAALPPAEEDTPPRSPSRKVPKRFFAPKAQELPPIVDASPTEEASPAAEPPTNPRNIGEWVRDLADLEVMRLLHHADFGVRHVAEKELERRNYSRDHLPLAKQLVHPDPRERRKLAEQLPRLANIDPRPWLLQLTEDDDEAVRRAAEGILQAARPGREPR